MILEKIYNTARPLFQSIKLEDFIFGLNLACAKLSDGSVGVSHISIEEVMLHRDTYDIIRDSINQPAEKLCRKIINGNVVEKTIAMTILNALSGKQNLADDDYTNSFGLEVKASDHLVLIGRIPLIMEAFKDKVELLDVFDMGLEAQGTYPDLTPMKKQKECLQTCDVLITSGTSVLNNTLENLLENAPNVREVVIVGPTTPMFPEAFIDTKVTCLAGSICVTKDYDKIIDIIHHGGNVIHLGPRIQKKCITL